MDDVIAVVTDLFFQARISSAARAAGRRVRYISAPEQAADFRLALVDLDAGADVLKSIESLRAATALGSIIAFGPHVDTARRAAARRSGADRVLAKSKFVTELATLMDRDR